MISELMLNHPVTNDPFRRLDHLLNMLSQKHEANWPLGSFCSGQCATNIWEEETYFIIEMEVPGADDKNVDLSLIGCELTVNIEVPETDESDVHFIRRERSCGKSTRIITLPLEEPPKEMDANIRNGILCVRFRKPEKPTVHKIDVQER